MRLVKIDGLYINPDRVDGVALGSTETICVYVGGESVPFKVRRGIEEVVKALTDAQEPRWIPVTERLPNREEYIANNGLFIVSDGERSYSEYFDIYDKECFGEPTMYGFRVDRVVAAWMPLPAPYKGGQEDGKA